MKKIRCSKTRKLLSPYVDGELTTPDRETLEAHVDSCQRCREELVALERLHSLFAVAERVSAPLGFSTKVMARADTASRTAPAFPFRELLPRPAAVLVSLGIVFAVITGSFTGKVFVGNLFGVRQPDVRTVFSLESFDASPSDSIAAVTLALWGDNAHE